MKKLLVVLLIFGVLLAAGGASFAYLSRQQATVPIEKTYGSDPALVDPKVELVPSVNVAEATPWPPGTMPTAAQGLSVKEFAGGLDHPRWLHVLPNGDVLVAESNAPPKPEPGFSVRAFAAHLIQGRAGAGSQSANRISLLRDADGDGVAETKTPFITGLNSPFGMALIGGKLYVANADAIVAFPYRQGVTEITAPAEKIVDLPAGRNYHWTKDVIASPDGTKLYVTVGSNSNVGENGMVEETGRAAVHEIDLSTRQMRQFASGLRNPNGLSWQPDSGALWVAVNERDELGPDLVPDYMTSVKDGAFYGWPYSWYGQHIDPRVKPQNPELVGRAIKPDYALGPHTASLGLTFNAGDLFGPEMKNGAFVGQHGSWNRVPRSGYKVIFVPFANGKPAGPPRDILTGFLTDDGRALGRPVGVAIARDGALLVADDVGNKVWRVVPTK
ncbi:sorbosone dehydrogenase family protein [Ensifer adhaerens]|uniref:PQQ-dependent sugar dehydrogenase n=1 Tax=Ensifer adhaerens TaxID=106592 RepID=UPI001CC0A09D|nr:sorbosone dehydrogenase family protein [Ensifer adhaerens]MBZ7924578.1 sorbosone dehydrogenase family protein [Ensifer adhaerens]UAX96186.1 sorbosone dehydrogenase family protein [Ensifer adhaerens]UAY04471.1 sorbosone dehydrogenase family protein [Ensifer adhaerens]UAY09903.1 sorbosone dehydrogenase family protein [Ensifer adhaerens]